MSHSSMRVYMLLVVQAMLVSSAWGAAFSWSNSAGGVFDKDANWAGPLGFPDDGADTARFALLAGYTVQLVDDVTNNNLEVRVGVVELDLFREPGLPFADGTPYTYTLDASSGFAADITSFPGAIFNVSLTLTGGESAYSEAASTVVASRDLVVGSDADTNGTLILDDVTWQSSRDAVIGRFGAGYLTISRGIVHKAYLVGRNGFIGANAGSSGNATVEGNWANTGSLFVGLAGNGTLLIRNRGLVENDGDGLLGAFSGAHGAVVLQSAGRWINHGSLYVGGDAFGAGGEGLLTIDGRILAEFASVTVEQNMTVWSGSAVNVLEGELNVDGQLTLHAGSELTLNGPDATINAAAMTMLSGAKLSRHEAGVLAIAGAANLAGALEFIVPATTNPQLGSAYQILTAGSVAGAFESTILPPLDAGLAWDVHYAATSVSLEVVPGFTADFDLDGDVDGDDLAQWQGDFGVNDLSDADSDGDSDGDDFLAWQRQLGSVAAATDSVQAVPEPTATILILVGMLTVCSRRNELVS